MLGRNGVLNHPKAGGIHHINQWDWCDGAGDAFYRLQQAKYSLLIVMNESQVNRDNFYELEGEVEHSYFWDRFGTNKRISLQHAVCFHKPEDGCVCRLPQLGLWHTEIADSYNRIITSDSWFVDSDYENLEFGRQLGMNLAWIYQGDDDVREPLDYHLFGSFKHFADFLLRK